jgi:hypothetical protein
MEAGMKHSPRTHWNHLIFTAVALFVLLGCNLFGGSPATPEPDQPAEAPPSQPGQGAAEANPAENPLSAGGTLTELPDPAPQPTTPPWQPQLTQVLLTQRLTPGQANTIEVQGLVKLELPADVYEGSLPDLVISQVTPDATLPIPGLRLLQAYDVSLGEVHELAAPVQVTLTYDPAVLKPGLPAPAQLRAGLYDTVHQRWLFLPTQIDETAHTITFSTQHFSTIALWFYENSDTVCETTHLKIYYDKTSIANATPLTKFVPGLYACSTSGHPDFISQIADYLENAYNGYVQEGFTFPAGKVEVIAAHVPADSYVWGDEPQFDTLTGDLFLTTRSWNNLDDLRQDCAHELFHYVQYYTSKLFYLNNQWWMDATADYAADKVAWVGSSYAPTNQMGVDIRSHYLAVSLEATKDLHAYSSAHFVDYLVSQSYAYSSFYDLYDSTDNLSTAIQGLQEGLTFRLGQSLGEVYSEFASYMLFEPSSKLPLKEGVIWGTGALKYLTEYPKGTGEVNLSATVQPYASQLWGIRLKDMPSFMSLEWLNENDGLVKVFIVSEGSERPGSLFGNRLYPNLPAILPVMLDQIVYVLMVNPTDDDLTFDMRLNVAVVETYTLNLFYDKANGAECADNSAWGTPLFRMAVKDGDVSIAYDSAVDDDWWTLLAEHTMVGAGAGKLADNQIDASLESNDTVRMGSLDASGNPVFGTITVRATLKLTANPENRFFWNGTAEGSAAVNLPANGEFKGFSCVGKVNGVSVYPYFYFPKPKK